MIALRTEREFELIRQSCRVVGAAHQALKELVIPGVSTGELDAAAEEMVVEAGAEPAVHQ